MRADFTSPAATLFRAATVPCQAPPCRPRPATARRSAGDHLREALTALGDCRGEILSHREKAWSSITFAGARHTLTMLFAGDAAVAAGERFIAALPDHEFAIQGQLVADAMIIEAEQRLLPTPRLVVECEVLLLEDS